MVSLEAFAGVAGTPAFIDPHALAQAASMWTQPGGAHEGVRVHAASDVYAFGVMLAHLVRASPALCPCGFMERWHASPADARGPCDARAIMDGLMLSQPDAMVQTMRGLTVTRHIAVSCQAAPGMHGWMPHCTALLIQGWQPACIYQTHALA